MKYYSLFPKARTLTGSPNRNAVSHLSTGGVALIFAATLGLFQAPAPALSQQSPTGAIVSEGDKSAQNEVGTETEIQTLQVIVANAGASTIDLFVKGDADDADLIPTGAVLDPGFEIVLKLELGMHLFAYENDVVADEQREHTPFYEVQIGSDAANRPLVIPDSRLFRLSNVTIQNTHSGPIRVLRAPLLEEPDFVEMAQLEAGASAEFGVFPTTEVIVDAVDSSFLAKYAVTLEPEQVFDLQSVLSPSDGLATVVVQNFSDGAITVDEESDTAIVRVAALEPQEMVNVDVQIDSEMKFYGGETGNEELGVYLVSDSEEQTVSVIEAEDDSVLALPPGLDLSVLKEEERGPAVGFLKKTEDMFNSKTNNFAPYVAYNHSDETLWFAGLKDDGEIVGAKQVRPNSLVNAIAGAGQRSIVWPGDIDPSEVTETDVFQAVNVSKKMNRIVDISRPEKVKFAISNGVCKPIDLFAITPFGEERLVTSIFPNQRNIIELNEAVHTTLVARAGVESRFAGDKIWSGVVPAGESAPLHITQSADLRGDTLRVSVEDPEDRQVRKVRLMNSSSRALEVYFVDDKGREFAISEQPLAEGTRGNFDLFKGDLIVLRRPNVGPETSEYARFRVSADFQQDLDVGDLGTIPEVAGSWSNLRSISIFEPNDVGTKFLTFVDQGDGRIKGSMNIGDDLVDGTASFVGCADETEAFGEWMPVHAGYACGDTYTFTQFEPREISGGRFYAHRVGRNELILKRGACGDRPLFESKWTHLPLHYDDMDPSKEAFERGMFDLAWAPPSFDWLGRGYDILRTDPLDYGKTSNGLNSDEPLFNFIFEDAAGQADQIKSKKIFGVNYLNENGSSANCTEQSKTVKQLTDLNDFSAKSYEGSAGMPAVGSFSLSKSNQEINTAATGKDHFYILERCDARLHALKTEMRWVHEGKDLMRQKLSPGFRKAVEELPLEWDQDVLLAFLKRFGTHFSERIVYGGTFFAKTEISTDTFRRGQQIGNTLQVEASGTLKKVQLGGGYKSEDKSGSEQQDINTVARYEKWSVGGTGADVYSKWAPTVVANPNPIDVKFRPNYDILTPIFFPRDPDIGLKYDLLKEATKAYFKSFGVDDLTSDPTDLPPLKDTSRQRLICFQLDYMELTFGKGAGSVNNVGGALALSVADENGKPVDHGAYPVYDFTGSDNLSRFEQISVGSNFTEAQCIDRTSEAFIHNGSLYIHGSVLLDRGTSGSKRLSKNVPSQTISLAEVEKDRTNFFPGTIDVEGSRLFYELAVWEQ